MASIRKRGSKYEVQIRRKGQRSVTQTFHLLSDAKQWARLRETQADRQEFGPDLKALNGITLGDLVTRYRDAVLPNNKSGSIEAIMLNAFLRHPICRKTLAELSPADFAAWRDERLKTTADRRAITPKSVKRLLSPIQHMFALAMEEWGIPLRANPLAQIRLRVTDSRRERRLRPGELQRLAEAARARRNPYLLPIILFALETAMRRGEILAMRWADVDLKRRLVRLPTSKNGHSRTIPLSKQAVAILSAFGTGEEFVFPTTPVALRQAWDRLTRAAKLEDLHFHDLRHEAISKFFEKGLTVPEVASISGHKDIRMLMRYAHADQQRIRNKIDTLLQDTSDA